VEKERMPGFIRCSLMCWRRLGRSTAVLLTPAAQLMVQGPAGRLLGLAGIDDAVMEAYFA
jgi:hypothetical protein